MATLVSLNNNKDMLYQSEYDNQRTAVCMAKLASVKFLIVCVHLLRDLIIEVHLKHVAHVIYDVNKNS